MKSDLVVVVADGGIEQAMRGLLSRPQAIGIRPLRGVEFPKLHKLDQGVYASGHEMAKFYRSTHDHALVLLDFAWEGRPTNDPAEMAKQIDDKLKQTWGDKGRCVVIVPELEIWIWSDSPHVAQILGWDNVGNLRAWLESRKLWAPGRDKPADPKAAYESAIREKKVQKSNATFNELAQRVSFGRCKDRAFLALLQILRNWFAVKEK